MTVAEPQAQPSKKTAPALERRISARFPLKQRCLVQRANTPRALPDGWRAIVYNISTHGVGVALPYPLPRGSELIIEAWDLPGAPPLHVRVVRAVPVEFAQFAGCELLQPLTEAQLAAWLRRRS